MANWRAAREGNLVTLLYSANPLARCGLKSKGSATPTEAATYGLTLENAESLFADLADALGRSIGAEREALTAQIKDLTEQRNALSERLEYAEADAADLRKVISRLRSLGLEIATRADEELVDDR